MLFLINDEIKSVIVDLYTIPVSKLKAKTDSEDVEVCPVCYGDLIDGIEPLSIKHEHSGYQGHIVCRECLMMHWFGPAEKDLCFHNDCPLCRTIIFDPAAVTEQVQKYAVQSEVYHQFDHLDGEAAIRVWTESHLETLDFSVSVDMLSDRIPELGLGWSKVDERRMATLVAHRNNKATIASVLAANEQDRQGTTRWKTTGRELRRLLMLWARYGQKDELAAEPERILYWIIRTLEVCTDLLVDQVSPEDFD
jgi:hypothetical protein